MNIIEAIEDKKLFGRYFKDMSTWSGWMVFLKGLFGLEMRDEEERGFFRQCTEREPGSKGYNRIFTIVGRRGGKSWIVSIIACYLALFYDYSKFLSAGENGYIVVIAKDRAQSQVVFRYIKNILLDNPLFSKYVLNDTHDSIELKNGIIVQILTASMGGVRGRTVVAALLDEIAYWYQDGTNPASEIYTALEPATCTIPNSMIIAISTAYTQLGLLWEMYERYWGNKDDEVLIWKAETRTMNPTISQGIIDRALNRDMEKAQAEWLGEFRKDLESFLHPDRIEDCVVHGRAQLGPNYRFRYRCAIDSAFKHDTFTIGISHYDKQQEKVVVDVFEGYEGTRQHPVSIDVIADRISELRTLYNINEVVGDQYSSEPIRQALQKKHVFFTERPFSMSFKHKIFSNLKALINETKIELLDHKKSLRELRTLEQRILPTGGVQIGAPRLTGYSDDYAVVLALVVSETFDYMGMRMFPNPQYPRMSLGHIDTTIARAKQRARRYGTNFRDEYRRAWFQ